MGTDGCQVCRLGRMDYGAAWELQKAVAAARARERIPDTLLLLEHPPTYTLGRRGDEAHLLVPRPMLEAEGIAVYRVDRGGDVTFHGPGQLVGYPVLSLEGKPGGASRYLRDLEEALILGLWAWGVKACRLPGLTGVWVNGEKIAAIGVKINAQRVTQHGFALNVSTDIGYFQRIIPCGIRDKGVTTLSRVLGRTVALNDVAPALVRAFGTVFALPVTDIVPHELLQVCQDGWAPGAYEALEWDQERMTGKPREGVALHA